MDAIQQSVLATALTAANKQDHDRILFVSNQQSKSSHTANIGLRHRIPSIDAYDGLTLARWKNYLRTMVGPKLFDQVISQSILQRFYGTLTPPLQRLLEENEYILGLASLRYYYSENGMTENNKALPRAYAVSHYISVDNENQSLEAIQKNLRNLDRSVILESASPSFSTNSANDDPGQVTIKHLRPNEVVLLANITKPAIVVLTDAYYPGWHAFIDGMSVPIWRANSLFRAVEVPKGQHEIVFKYQPASLHWGAVVSVGTLCLILAMLYFFRCRRTNSESKTIGVMV